MTTPVLHSHLSNTKLVLLLKFRTFFGGTFLDGVGKVGKVGKVGGLRTGRRMRPGRRP